MTTKANKSLRLRNILSGEKMDKKNITFTEFLSEENGIISGYASVFNVVDQHNDLIKANAFKSIDHKKIKLLWQHKADEPIGIIEEIYEDQKGLFFKAKLLLDLPIAKSAYNLIKAKAISGVSIGFKPLKFYYKDETRVIEKIDLWEISLVTFPANKEANVLEVKHQSKIGENMQQKTWENFKSVNDEILHSIEQKGSADPLLNQQLLRMNNEMDEYKSRLNLLETTMARPFSSGETFVSNADNEHKSAFTNYLRSGNEQNLNRIEKKSLSSVTSQDGGYLITNQIYKQINKVLEEISPMRKLASCEQISTSSLDIIEDYEKAQAGWVSERDLRDETDTPTISKRNIPVFEIFAQPAATQKLIDDSFIDIEKWLAEKLTNSFAKLENQAFLHGDGINCPRGILTYANGKDWGKIEQVKSMHEDGIDQDALFNLYFSLKSKYCNNASFLMNRSSIHHIRTLKDKTSGRYLWSPALASENPDTLIGLPIYEAADMPALSKTSLSIALADFKSAYKIVDRAGIRVMRDPYTFKPFVKFYTTKRVGGDVINFEAIKLMSIGA